MKARRKIKIPYPVVFAAGFVFIVLLLLPLFTYAFLVPEISSSSSVKSFLVSDLPRLIWNNAQQILFVCGTTLTLGVFCAWVCFRYEFAGRAFFEKALILPLAVPTYIAAFSYSDILSYTGWYGQAARYFSGSSAISYPDPFGKYFLFLLLAFVLYPYVYVASSLALNRYMAGYLETAASLGAGEIKKLFGVFFPLARYYISGGVAVVLFELLNDYGAARYFGFETLTTYLVSAWLSLSDLGLALFVSLMLLGLACVAYMARKFFLGGKLDLRHTGRQDNARVRPSAPVRALLSLICFIPLFFGFLIPVTNYFFLSLETGLAEGTALVAPFLNTLLMIAVCVFSINVSAIVICYAGTVNPGAVFYGFMARTAAAGYGLPGVIIAVLVLSLFSILPGMEAHIATTTLAGLFFAMTFRFFGVAHANYDSASTGYTGYHDMARSLGMGPWRAFLKSYLPFLSRDIFPVSVLLAIEIIKELPLTLILRPFNFETLATVTYNYASDERLGQAAFPALLICFSGLVAVFFMYRRMNAN